MAKRSYLQFSILFFYSRGAIGFVTVVLRCRIFRTPFQKRKDRKVRLISIFSQQVSF